MSQNSIVASLEGEVSYTDGTSADFGVFLDAAGNIKGVGSASAFADVLDKVKGLFTALGGTLTTAPTASSKTVKDSTVRFEAEGTVGSALFEFFAEYTVKSGTFIGGGGRSDYATAVANFKTNLQNMLRALVGVAVTVA